jgi:Rap1a immunity proteins
MAIGLVSTCYARASLSDMKGIDLYKLCQTNASDCDSVSDAALVGMLFRESGRKEKRYCPPPGVLEGAQARLVIEKYMRDHPERLHESARDVIWTAMETAFPCRNSN